MVETSKVWSAATRATVLAALIGAIGGCAKSSAIQDGTASAVTAVSDLPAPNPRDLGGSLQTAYYIGAQDKLDIIVYQLPEVTRQVLVDPAGLIHLPFVGAITAGGRTVDEVRLDIRDRLSHDVLQNPDVTVALADGVSQRVTVEGAVAQPGVYPVGGPTNLVQAIALAHGTNNVANEHIVAIFRKVDGKDMAAVFDLSMIRDGKMPNPAVYGNDIIIVERSRGKVLLRDVIGTLPLLGVFRGVNSAINLVN